MELYWYFEPNPAYLRYTNHFMKVSWTICVTGPVNLRALKISVKCNWAVAGMEGQNCCFSRNGREFVLEAAVTSPLFCMFFWPCSTRKWSTIIMLMLKTDPACARQVIRNGTLTNAWMVTGLILCLGSLDFDKCVYASQKNWLFCICISVHSHTPSEHQNNHLDSLTISSGILVSISTKLFVQH